MPRLSNGGVSPWKNGAGIEPDSSEACKAAKENVEITVPIQIFA
jgi:hypothetical protein